MDPNLSVDYLTGVGKYYALRLKKLQINTLEDLIYHFPFRYDDFSHIATIQNTNPGEKLTIQGVVWQIKNVRTRIGKFLTNAQVADESGVIDVIWFNQPYLTKNIKAGTHISLSGKVVTQGSRPKLISPTYEILKSTFQHPRPGLDQDSQDTTHTGRLVPIYPETEGVTSKWLRQKIRVFIHSYTQNLSDFVPQKILLAEKLTDLKTALNKIHFPQNYTDVETATKRLAFDELFLTQIISQMRKREWHESRTAPKLKTDSSLVERFIKNLPFTLTGAQSRVIKEVSEDLSKNIPMNRLLEGDVGSGKTVLAAVGALITNSGGFDTLIAAPTEILAFQHFKSISDFLTPFGIKVGIWTANKKEAGNVTCGTHALLTSYKAKNTVGFVVVDEQHRFGVAQRAQLFMTHNQKLTPHLLTMTATPIPRTLALTLYGDLDLSILDEMPRGRQKISTFVVPNKKRSDCYKFIEREVTSGRQAFIITPFVEPSESMTTVKAATVEFEKLKTKFTKSVKLGLLHGRLKSKDKEKIINTFKKGKIDVLVATPVVEVGIDVPNASIIMVESAERFGLAQLHQLRGRVGRGEHKSYCFLFTDANQEQSTKRLKSMEKVHVGFELAEIDLKLRGSGQIFGLKQSGFENFKIADIGDIKLITMAQKHARELLKTDSHIDNFPLLKEKLNKIQVELSQPN